MVLTRRQFHIQNGTRRKKKYIPLPLSPKTLTIAIHAATHQNECTIKLKPFDRLKHYHSWGILLHHMEFIAYLLEK